MKKILIVDDSAMIRLVVSKATAEAGYEALLAANGQQGLEQLERHRDIALIVCDVNMPEMDGLEMVRRIKSNQRFKYIPILMLTTESKPELKQQARQIGVKAWMLKPFNPVRFSTALMKLIG